MLIAINDPWDSTHNANHILIISAHLIAGEADGEILGNYNFEIVLLSQKLNVIFNPEKYLKFG